MESGGGEDEFPRGQEISSFPAITSDMLSDKLSFNARNGAGRPRVIARRA